ncbi:MAG: trigger factor [Zoogloeaceae bacterium]|jgi:trigger factor|nr:trigger factor [Zoogloeaceae bacterium]
MQTQENAGVSALERRFDMAIAKADLDKEVQHRLRELSGKVKMAGFRPGKVPMNIVAQQYGPQAQSEAISAILEKAFGEEVRSRNLRVAGYPRIEQKAATGQDKLEFTAIFEVYPEIKLGDVSEATIDRATLTVGDAEVDKTIGALRKQRVTYVAADRPAAQDDRLTIDFTGRKGGEEFEGGKAVDFVVVLGAGMMLPDFEAALAGMKTGESKTFDVTFPADYHAKNLAGQQVQFDTVMKKIEAPKLPELDADFARILGVKDGDLTKMRDEVKTNLEREVKKRLQAKTKNQVMDALLSVNNIDVPKALVNMEAEQMAEHARKDMETRGMDPKKSPIEVSWFTDHALRRVKLGLVFAELVKEKELQAKPEQVKAIVEEYAQTFEDPKEVVRWYYSEPQRLAEAEALAMENNVVEWMLANAKVADKPVSFDEIMGNAA